MAVKAASKESEMVIISPPRDLSGKRFCSDINSPDIFVTVHRICKAANGFQVLFKCGENGNQVFCGYKKFLKLYPHELKD